MLAGSLWCFLAHYSVSADRNTLGSWPHHARSGMKWLKSTTVRGSRGDPHSHATFALTDDLSTIHDVSFCSGGLFQYNGPPSFSCVTNLSSQKAKKCLHLVTPRDAAMPSVQPNCCGVDLKAHWGHLFIWYHRSLGQVAALSSRIRCSAGKRASNWHAKCVWNRPCLNPSARTCVHTWWRSDSMQRG